MDNDNIIEFFVKAYMDSFNKAFENAAQLTKNMRDEITKVSNITEPAMAKFRSYSTTIKNLSDASAAKIKKNTEQITSSIHDMVTSFYGTDTMKNFSSVVSSLSFDLNDLSKIITKFSNLSKIENVLDFSFLDKVDVTPIQTFIDKFKEMESINMNNTANALNRMATAMNRINKVQFDVEGTAGVETKMSTLTESFRKYLEMITGFNLDGLKSFTKDIKELPKAMKSIETINAELAAKNIETITEKIRSFIVNLKEGSVEIKEFSNILNKMGGKTNIEPIKDGVRQTSKAIKDMGDESNRTQKKLSTMLSAGKLYAFYNQVRHFGRGFLDILNKSIDFNEIENYFARAMDNMYDKAMVFQNKLSDMFGLAMPQMMQAQATFKNMLGSLGGLSDEMSYQLSERVTQMALDFSSLYNTTIDGAMTKFQAALSKQVRPIRSVSGYDITQNVLGATMQEIGLNDRKITQMNEIEKRLLVILTLQQQMAKSNAMNDFSRTIENPANQLRILQQQLSEVGRWISAVFYGTIARVLPYINGFVMAIKELVKAFALFLGYEMPDSSGTSGTILDQMDEGFGDVSEDIGDVNSGLDDTSKKLKTIEGQLASFDKLNVITPPSDSNAGSSGGGASGGTGGMTVDPRILDALNKYKNIFDDIHMRASDIRDMLLVWAAILGGMIDENIFQPIQISWDKYGASILQNAKSAFDDIGYIAGSMFDVVGDKWKPFFQAASDLFFSLLDTGSLVFSTITNLLRIIWDHGGKYLFEAIWDLATAFIKLATSVNDNFVKPLIRGINNTIVPIVGYAIGLVLEAVGRLLKGLAGIITWIADCKPLVIALGTAFTTMFLTIKIAKFINLVSSMKDEHKILKTLVQILYDHNSIFRKAFDLWVDAKNPIQALRNTYINLNNALVSSNIWQKVGGYIQSFANKMKSASKDSGGLTTSLKKVGKSLADGVKHFITWIKQLVLGKTATVATTATTTAAAAATSGMAAAEATATATTGTLSTALTFLANNPMVILVTAIAAIVSALLIFNSTQKDSTYEMEDYSQAVQDQITAIDDLSTSLSDAKDSANDRMASSEAEIKTMEKQIDMLKSMGGESGYVKDIAKAQGLVDAINNELPDTVKLTKDGRLEWQKTPEEIKKATEALREKAKVEAYSQLYTESIKTQITAEREHAKAVKALTDNEIDRAKKKQLLNEIIKKGYNATEEETDMMYNLRDEIKQLEADHDGLEKAVSKSSDTLKEATKSTEELADSMSGTNDILNNTASALVGLDDAQRTELNKLGASLAGTKQQLEDYANGNLVLDENQVKSATEAKAQIINSYAERAIEYGKKYDEMLAILQEQGIELTDEEKRQLKQSYDNLTEAKKQEEKEFNDSKKRIINKLKENNKDMSTEEEKQYSILLDKLKEHGVNVDVERAAQYQAMLNELDRYGIKANSGQADIYMDLFSLLEQNGIDIDSEQGRQYAREFDKANKSGRQNGEAYINKLKEGIKKGDIKPEGANKRKELDGYFKDPISVRVQAFMDSDAMRSVRENLESLFSGVFTGKAKYSQPKKYATGGLPPVGEMFIAREKGPEYVGTMGGKSAVANNDQIETGIENASYRGMKRALMESNGGKQKMNVYLTNYTVVDGKIVKKEIKKVNEEEVLKTGKPLFKK